MTSVGAPVSDPSGQAGPSRYGLLVLAMFAAMFEGYDGQLVGFLSPTIAADWNLPKSEFGTIFSVGLFGLIIGAVSVAPLADRWGRRAIAIAGSVVVAVFTLLTTFVQTPVELAAARMLTGIGLGSLMPLLVTIAHEAATPKHKGLFVTLIVTAFPLGSFVGGLLVAWGLAHVSWRVIFAISGVVAALFAVIFWKFLWPADLSPRARDVAAPTTVASLLREQRWFGTLMAWLLFFATLVNVYTIGAWLPLLFQRGGMDAITAVKAASSAHLGATVGSTLMGLLAARFGGIALMAGYVAGAAGLVALGFSIGSTVIITAAVGVLNLGAHAGNNVIVARIYPPRMNATGIGWAQGWGRVGCVLGPALVGWAVGHGFSNQSIFFGLAVAALTSAAAALGIALYERRHP